MQITLEPKVEDDLKRISEETARSPTRQANLVLSEWIAKYDRSNSKPQKSSNRRDK